MNKQRDRFGRAVLVGAVMFVTMTACKRDSDGVDNTPGHFIVESEQLVIPDAVSLPANAPGTSRVVTFYAEGVQKYKAQQKAGSDPAVFEWVFVAPQAKLFSSNNVEVGSHSAGPTWQLAGPQLDTIYGQAFTPAKTSPSPDGQGIDWLLLMPKTGKTATGLFADVAFIQRIATKGGKAPATPPTSADQTVDVNYTAVYRFSKLNK